jgi:uncharacterized repeat protein (TIGR04052 family)
MRTKLAADGSGFGRKFTMQHSAKLCAAIALVSIAACSDDDDPPNSGAPGGSGGRGGSGASSGRGGSGGSAGTSGNAGAAGSGALAGSGGTDASAGTGGSGATAGSDGSAGSAGSAGTAGDGGVDADASNICDQLGSRCHPYDLGAGEAHECHEIGHAGDAAACAAAQARCLALCSPGDGGTLPVQLKFGAKLGSEPFSCTGTYSGVGTDNSTIKPVDLRFYVHDVRLIAAGGVQTPVTLDQSPWQYQNVALIDLEDRTGSCADGTAETNALIKGTVPKGIYNGVAFKLGVPSALNHADVSTAPSPLNVSGLYWSWLMGRIFLSSMIEAQVEGDAGSDAGRPVSNVHLGSTGCTGSPQDGGAAACSKPNRPEFTFPSFRFSRTITFDVKALYSKSPARATACHSFTQDGCLWPFEQLGINFATGTNTPTTQTVFRVE